MIIAFEGIDGAGKTTLVQGFNDAIEMGRVKGLEGCKVEIIKFPQHQEIRELARKFTSPAAKMMLFMSDMRNIIDTKIKLNPLTIFLVDRYDLSTFIYQTLNSKGVYKRELNLLFINLQKEIIGESRADHIVYVKADPGVCWERLKKRGFTSDDNETPDMLKTLAEAYEGLLGSRDLPTIKFTDIDGNKTPDEMLQQLISNFKV